MMPGICVDTVRVSERRPRSYSARQARFSMATGVLRWNRKRAADPYRSRRHFRSDIAARKLSHRQHVRSRLLVQQRRVLPDSHLGIDHGSERFVGDLDPIERILREVSVLGQNRHNRLTDIANLVARQRIERRRMIILHPRRRAHRLDQVMQILRGVDGEDARHLGGRRGADACDEGMRVIAAPERDVKCARDDAIGRERSLAGQQPRILDALDARADALGPQPKADIRAFDPECSLATVSHRSRPLSSGCPIAHRRDRRSRWCRSLRSAGSPPAISQARRHFRCCKG